MKAKKHRLLAVIVCLIVAFTLVVFAACKQPEEQPKKLDHIELNTSSVTKEFTAGDTLTYKGLAVTAFYDDDTHAVVAGYSVTANNLDDGKLTVNSNQATVSYTEDDVTQTASYSITVTAAIDPNPSDTDPSDTEPEVKVESIEITQLPTQTEYYVDERFTAEGLELEVTYEDETTATVTEGYEAYASTAAAGLFEVTVTYKGATDSFIYTVHDKLTALEIVGANRYNLNDAFAGVSVSALYNGNTSGGAPLSEGDEGYQYTINPALNGGKFDTAGDYTVTVTYSEERIDGRPLNVSKDFVIIVIDPSEPRVDDVYNVYFGTDLISVWFKTANYTQQDMQAAELLVDGNKFANPSNVIANGNAGEYQLQFTNIKSLTGSESGTRYVITFRLNGQSYSPVNNLQGGSFKSGASTYTLSVSGSQIILTVTTVVVPEPQPGEVIEILVTRTDFYADGFVKIYVSEADMLFIKERVDHVVTNGVQYSHGKGSGFLVDGDCIQIQYKNGDTSFRCEWYDANNTLIATCEFAREEVTPNPGDNTDPDEPIGGEDYVVKLTQAEYYNDMFVKLSMSAKDFELLSGASKVVVNDSYAPTDWGKGFMVDGTTFIHVRIVATGPAPSGTYTLTWYNDDGDVIATCSFTI